MAKLRAIEEEQRQWNSFREGNQDALAELFLSQYDKLFRYGSRLYGNEDRVKDCIQEVFLKLWHRQESLPYVGEITPYLCKALRRTIIDTIRKDAKLVRIWDSDDERDLEVIFSPEDFIISQQVDEEQRHRLTSALNQLTKRQREAIHLRYFENFEPHQVAQIMGLSNQSVYNLLYRSVQALRDNFFLLLLFSLD